MQSLARIRTARTHARLPLKAGIADMQTVFPKYTADDGVQRNGLTTLVGGRQPRVPMREVLAVADDESQVYGLSQRRFVSNTKSLYKAAASPFDPSLDSKQPKKKKGRKKFIPPKAAVELTPKARKFFKLLLENPPRKDVVGIMLNYKQASSGQPRMVFSFDFVSQDQIHEDDEGVSLELLEDGTPKPPKDSIGDGLPKLYLSHNGFMKFLGCKLDVDIDNVQPILYNKEGLEVDPNV